MIASSRHDAVVRIEIQRHDRRNALNTALCDALRAEVESAASHARCLVLHGQGSSFCAGADLNDVYGEEFRTALYTMLESLRRVQVPVIAAVNGPAIGAGTQLAMACDLRVADADARFAVPTARNGMAVDAWTIRRLRALAGGGPAARMMLAAQTLEATSAVQCGLADRIGTVDDAMAWAHELSALAPLAVAYNKMVLNETAGDAAIEAEFSRLWSSHDVQEAAQARKDNRAPEFLGE